MQLPQCLLSVMKSAQPGLVPVAQQLLPPVQAAASAHTHMPDAHPSEVAAEHTLPHVPQLLRSVRASTQAWTVPTMQHFCVTEQREHSPPDPLSTRGLLPPSVWASSLVPDPQAWPVSKTERDRRAVLPSIMTRRLGSRCRCSGPARGRRRRAGARRRRSSSGRRAAGRAGPSSRPSR